LGFLLAISAFNLGRYSVEFIGRLSAWLTVIGGIAALIGTSSLLVFVTVSVTSDNEKSKQDGSDSRTT
jgi:hypothetical protein